MSWAVSKQDLTFAAGDIVGIDPEPHNAKSLGVCLSDGLSTSTTTQVFSAEQRISGTVRAVEATIKRDYILRAVVQVRLISIISPLLNEAERVERFVADVAAKDLELGAYGALADASAGISIHGRCEFWSLLPRVTIGFPVSHSGYAIGMLRGWIRAAAVTAAPR
jgi:hypothetical protein